MNKTPKIDWEAKTETVDDIQYSYIAKSVAYNNNYGVCMFAGRRDDNPTPVQFWYIFLLDIDPTKEVSMCFQKRGRYKVGMDFMVQPLDNGEMAIMLPNLVTFSNSSGTLNLFQAHINSDTIVFDYTTKEGKQKTFRFSLAGFNERYLEQFI